VGHIRPAGRVFETPALNVKPLTLNFNQKRFERVHKKHYCCNHSAGIVLNARFTTNGMFVKNNTRYMWREQAIIE